MARLRTVGFLAAMLLAAEPCLAAPFEADGGLREQQVSGFAGLNVRVPLRGATNAKPSARLQLSLARSVRAHRTGAFQTARAPGLELAAGAGGKPALYMGGQNVAAAKTRIGFKGTTGTVILVGVGVLAVLLLVAAASTPPQVDFDD